MLCSLPIVWPEVMRITKLMVASFQRSHECTAKLSAPDPSAGHHWPTPPLKTPGRSQQVWVSLLWGHCSFLLVSGVHKSLLVPSKSLFPQLYVGSGGSMAGLMVTSSKRAYATPRSAVSRDPAPVAGHCWLGASLEALKHSSASVSVGSLGLGEHKICLSPLSVSGG